MKSFALRTCRKGLILAFGLFLCGMSLLLYAPFMVITSLLATAAYVRFLLTWLKLLVHDLFRST